MTPTQPQTIAPDSQDPLAESQQDYRIGIFKNGVEVRKTDHRGYYICASSGVFYLWSDGIIRNGASKNMHNDPDATAFWPSQRDAIRFYTTWVTNL